MAKRNVVTKKIGLKRIEKQALGIIRSCRQMKKSKDPVLEMADLLLRSKELQQSVKLAEKSMKERVREDARSAKATV